MLPVIALVGRPNVGKSTLFNRLTGTRDALVADFPGLTRDRIYGVGRLGARPYLVVDTGGLSGNQTGIDSLMAKQTLAAIQETSAVLLLVDGRSGPAAADQEIAAQLRKLGKPVFLVVNKTEGLDRDSAAAEFHALGIGSPYPVSAAHGQGVEQLMDAVLGCELAAAPGHDSEAAEDAMRVAVVGRPNVGKSTLINRLLGEDRVVTFDQPGTTRDSIHIPFERDGRNYVLIDTAGVRRKSRVEDVIEKFSIIKTLQAVDAAHVVIVVLDASEAITDQDAHLLGMVVESGRALVLAVNKWDGLSAEQRATVKRSMDIKFAFLDFAEVHFISALHGSGLGPLFKAVIRAHRAATVNFPTPRLTRVLQDAVTAHAPPLVHGHRIKLRYAHQGGLNPPLVIVHGNQTQHVPKEYTRYLSRVIRKAFKLTGTPIRIEYRSGENPYAGRKNPLTKRQVSQRRRMMRHVKKRG